MSSRARFLAILGFAAGLSLSASVAACPELLNYRFEPLTGGAERSLCQYQGKVVLVVNTASECGFTPQYEGLEALHRKFRDRGLVVLGFPSNDFGNQEPGSERQIAEFCRLNYGVSFPRFGKTVVSGPAADPLYVALGRATGEVPQWNFHKYLIDRSGARVQSFPTRVAPESQSLVSAVERALAAQ
jgi:glutathione peroxidase